MNMEANVFEKFSAISNFLEHLLETVDKTLEDVENLMSSDKIYLDQYLSLLSIKKELEDHFDEILFTQADLEELKESYYNGEVKDPNDLLDLLEDYAINLLEIKEKVQKNIDLI